MISPERFSECTLVVSKFWALGLGLEQEEELMITKRVLCPSRLRLVPNQFSWVDHRLVRESEFMRGNSVKSASFQQSGMVTWWWKMWNDHSDIDMEHAFGIGLSYD